MHLEAKLKLDYTKDEIKEEVTEARKILNRLNRKLVMWMSYLCCLPLNYGEDCKQSKSQNLFIERISPIEKEFRHYEAFTLPENVNVLQWWKCHENVLPLLS